ncbi:phosphoribosyltransferase-like protein [Methylobacterium sp. Leaf85]|uniref:phosphoribosyltransferase-like protein n=1 Tax=Methylobacterium sp. Leaf85 TaxID=1736241 RepID=UPI000A9F8B00|nr:hypothetical protein [Methylobacterium sp. Leaf85]
MNVRTQLLTSIASTIEDYRPELMRPPTPDHVERWINQFPQNVQLPILSEMNHALSKSYFPKKKVKKIIKAMIRFDGWVGADPVAFWRQVNFLNIQPRGHSQTELLTFFDQILREECGISTAECNRGNKFLYLDDGLFSGGRIGADLGSWITNTAPPNAELFIGLIASHTQGRFFVERDLKSNIEASGKNITVKWGAYLKIENGLYKVNDSDVLRPTSQGLDEDVAAYVASLGKPQTWRTGASVGPKEIFSSAQGREVLEQEFLKKGISIRAMCGNLNEYQRPLGNTLMKTVGFGTLFVTYRNCPNNAPLVLWAGDPWYPLFLRKTN